MEGVKAALKSNKAGVVMLASLVASASYLAGSGADLIRTYDALATDLEVAEAIAEHEKRMRPIVEDWKRENDLRISGLEDAQNKLEGKVDQLLANDQRRVLEEELATLYRYKCRTNNPDMDDLIGGNRREFNRVFGVPYQVRECNYYLSR